MSSGRIVKGDDEVVMNNKADFVIENREVKQPDIVSDDSLALYYDTKGKTNTDYHKSTLLDMSGNGKHGELNNFAYENLSGYTSDGGLVFDGVDDTLTVPKLNGINANNFTYQLNNNILAFTGDEFKTVKNGDVEVLGRNLLPTTYDLFTHDGGTYDFYKFLEEPEQVIVTVRDRDTSVDMDNVYFGLTQTGRSYVGGTWLMSSGDLIHSERLSDYQNYFSYYPDNEETLNKIFQRFNIQIEKGTIATDWTPAPEDLLEATELKGNILGDMEDVIDDHTRDEQSGVEVFTDKADDSVVHVEIDGKSYQHAGSGKNFFNKNKIHEYSTGEVREIITVKNRQVIELSGAGIDIDNLHIYEDYKENTQYTARARIKSNSNYGNGSIRAEYTDGTTSGGYRVTDWSYSYFTTDPNKTVSKFYFTNGGNGRHNPFYLDINSVQIEEGSERTEYEPPAPTPDYPIEIHSLNDFDVVSSVGKRNLLRNSNFRDGGEHWYTYGNPLYEIKDNVVLSGGETFYVKLRQNLGQSIVPGDIYYARAEVRALSDFFRLQFQLGPISNYNNSFGFTTPIKDEWVIASGIIEAGSFNNYTFAITSDNRANRDSPLWETKREVQLINLTATFGRGNEPSKEEADEMFRVWSPAPEDIKENDNHPLIDKINLSLSEPLRSVGDAHDRLFRDSDGLWKIERNIGEAILDGTEPWISEGKHWYTSWSSRYGVTKNSFNLKSSHYVWLDRGSDALGNTGITYGAKNHSQKTHNGNIIIYHPRISNVTELREFLKSEQLNGTPVITQHELESPEIETLDQEIQDKLNNLRSLQGSNYVYTVINDKTDNLSPVIQENLKPTLHSTFQAKDYLKESRTVNNLLMWDRSLNDDELLHQNRLFHRRFNFRSDTIKGEPVVWNVNLLNGGVYAHSLEQNYTISI